MADSGRLQLRAVNARGEFLNEKIDIMLRPLVLSETKKAIVTTSHSIVVTNLTGEPQGTYRIEIDPPSYLPINRFVSVRSSGTTALEAVFAVDPKKVKSFEFPKFGSLAAEAQ